MRRVIWSQPARQDLRKIVDYSAERNADASESVFLRIDQAVRALGQLPTGRLGRLAGTYEKVVSGLPYIVAYEFGTDISGAEIIFILHVIHGARDWTRDRWPDEDTP
jgi:toxin ParE1/3/4